MVSTTLWLAADLPTSEPQNEARRRASSTRGKSSRKVRGSCSRSESKGGLANRPGATRIARGPDRRIASMDWVQDRSGEYWIGVDVECCDRFCDELPHVNAWTPPRAATRSVRISRRGRRDPKRRLSWLVSMRTWSPKCPCWKLSQEPRAFHVSEDMAVFRGQARTSTC